MVGKQVARKNLGKELHSHEGFKMDHARLTPSLKPGDLPVGLRSPLDKGYYRSQTSFVSWLTQAP